MATFLQTNEIDIEHTTVKTNVPNNDVVRLMYYLSCVCTGIDCNDDADIRRFISYQNWYRLSNAEKQALVVLCYTINPNILEDKVFFQCDALCVEFNNEFYTIREINYEARYVLLFALRSKSIDFDKRAIRGIDGVVDGGKRKKHS